MQTDYSVDISPTHINEVDLKAFDDLHKSFGDERVSRLFWKQATPNVLATIFYQICVAGVVAALSRSGVDSAAAYSFAAPFHIVHVAAGMFISGGTSNTISKVLGSRSFSLAYKAASQSFYLATILSALMIGCIYPFIDKILKFLGTPDVLMYQATLYAKIMICGGFITNFTMWSNAVLRSQGLSKYVLISSIFRGSVSLIFGCCFIILKKWVMTGFCAAFLSGDLVAFIINMCYIYISKRVVIRPKFTKLSSMFFQVIVNGSAELTAGLSTIVMVSLVNYGIISLEEISGVPSKDVISVSIVMIASRVNTSSITQTLSQIAVIMALNTTLPMANYNREARNWDRLRKINLYSLFATLFTMASLSVLLIAFSPLISRIYFTTHEERKVMEYTLQLSCAGWAFVSITTNTMEIIQSFGMNRLASKWSLVARTGVSIGVYVYVFKKCANMWAFIKAFPVNIAISSGLSILLLLFGSRFFVLTKKAVKKMEQNCEDHLNIMSLFDHMGLIQMILYPIRLILGK